MLTGHGYDVIEVEGDDLPGMHRRFADALSRAWTSIKAIQAEARSGDWDGTRPRWPMIVLRTPKGWTGPDVVDGVQASGTWRSHQVPLAGITRRLGELMRDTYERNPDRFRLFCPDETNSNRLGAVFECPTGRSRSA
ncbi:phosphoketolase family protein [Nonomuraea sp. NPDC003707]